MPWSLWISTALWLGSVEFTIIDHRNGFFVSMAVAVVLALLALWQWRKKLSTNVAALASGMTMVISLAGVSFAPGWWAQQAVAVVSALLLVFIGQQRLRQHDDLRGRTTAFTTALLIWLSWFSLLSASVFLNIRLGWLVAGGSVVTALAALLVWLETGITFRQSRWGLLALLWLGAELFVVTWWLPTTIYVGSAVATTILALVIQASRHLLRGRWEPGRSRRYLMIGSTITATVLLTARLI